MAIQDGGVDIEGLPPGVGLILQMVKIYVRNASEYDYHLGDYIHH